MKQLVGRILSTLISSLFVSGVMFIVGLSVITRQFPPDFGQIQSSYESLTQMSGLANELNSSPELIIEGSGLPDESDVDTLTAINRKRAEISEGLLGAVGSKKSKDTEVTSTNLNAEVRELKMQLFRLQQRVSELEAQQYPHPTTEE